MINKQKAAIMFDSELYNSRFDPTWNRHVLYSLAEWINGMAFRNINFTSNGKPVIKIAEIKNGISGQTKFTQRDYDSIYHVTDGDMLFSWSGQPDTSIDVFRWRGPDGWLNQHIFKVHPKDQCLEAYFFYLLKYLNPNFVRIARNKQTTGLGHVTKRDLQNMKVGLPSEDKQRAIAHILGSLDDKIELNRQMNRTLEAMTQAIFKSWFVDFDPVRAKAEGRDPSLPKEIADLFPDSFEDSELGEIPKGWGETTIGAEFDLTMGQSPPGSTYNEKGDGLPFFQGRRDFGFRYPSDRVYCTEPKRFANKGDTLVSVRAPVGDINIAYEKCCVGRGVAAVRHKLGSRSYTYYAMHTLSDRFARFEAEGTVFGAINKKQFESLRWLFPQDDLVNEFEKIAFPLDERIEKNTNETITLASLRDTLLPKLISGQLRVPDAEKFIEETVR